ncbi:MAG: hypothetical protein BZY88_08860 [SAR202 cluster bacterium Io17-Chloro-G9]|nr:MAG: hypothetical protein BZY88_08860 [SAR202 cluster bacterium Io17-Chloro-G9]
MEFAGFTPGTLYTPVPNPLFGPLLEQIEDLAELKVTLRGLWLLHRKRTWPRMVSIAEFLNDQALLRGLEFLGNDPGQEIRRGLHQAVARQTLLHYTGASEEAASFYLLNTESDRRALDKLNRGEHRLPEDHVLPWVSVSVETAGPKSNIFALYEDNIGMLTPILAEELKEAEELYPWVWVCEAFQIAAAENRRRWGYISAILRRWAAEGKDDGKSGRYPKKNNRQKYDEDYQRRWGLSS